MGPEDEGKALEEGAVTHFSLVASSDSRAGAASPAPFPEWGLRRWSWVDPQVLRPHRCVCVCVNRFYFFEQFWVFREIEKIVQNTSLPIINAHVSV